MRALILLSMFLVFSTPVFIDAAVLYIDTEERTYGRGDNFIASVRIDNEDTCINATKVEVAYPTDTLRAVDFSKGSSILNFWTEEPSFDLAKGLVTFSGGIPGGYCGRIQGDPVLSNILGRIVFVVIAEEPTEAVLTVTERSEVYESDGLGTLVQVRGEGVTIDLETSPTLAENPWLEEVGADTTPPEPFEILVQKTEGVLGGKYYAAFSTLDKQSGIDHFEIFERGAWKQVTSPYTLRDQLLRADVQIKAIDKAGNERLGTYTPVPGTREAGPMVDVSTLLFGVLGVLLTFGALRVWMALKKRDSDSSPTRSV